MQRSGTYAEPALRRLVKNRALDMLRSRRQDSDVGAVVEEDPAPSPFVRLLAKEVRVQALKHITERQAEVWQAIVVDGNTVGEVARRLGVTRKSVINVLRRAERSLARLGEEIVGSRNA